MTSSRYRLSSRMSPLRLKKHTELIWLMGLEQLGCERVSAYVSCLWISCSRAQAVSEPRARLASSRVCGALCCPLLIQLPTFLGGLADLFPWPNSLRTSISHIHCARV